MESLFKSALRTFLKTFFAIIGIFIAIVPLIFFLMMVGSDYDKSDKYIYSILPDLEGKQQPLPPSAPAILRINIQGIIGMNPLTTQDMETLLLDSQRGILKNQRVKGILLYVNSPGGEVTNSDGIYRSLLRYKEKYKIPIYAFVDGLCASGGFYVSSAADKIYASPTSIIGSIGVRIGPFFNISEIMKRFGIQSETIIAGKDKDMMSPFRPWKEDEDKNFQAIISFLYDRFVNIVTDSRKEVSKKALINEYGAQVFDGERAKEIGYIDQDNCDVRDAIEDLLTVSKIDKKKPYQIVELKPKRFKFKEMLDTGTKGNQETIRHEISFVPENTLDRLGHFFYLYRPQNRIP